MIRMLRVLILSVLFSFSPSYALDAEFISASNSNAFLNFFPTGYFIAVSSDPSVKTYKTQQIINDFKSNELMANDKYKKTFILYGEVRSVKESVSGEPYLVLAGPNSYTGVNAYFDKSAKPSLLRVKRGDKIDLVCRDASLFVVPNAECHNIQLAVMSSLLTFDELYQTQNMDKYIKTAFILYSLLENKIESECDKSAKSCDIATMKLIKTHDDIIKMLKPYSVLISDIGERK